MTNEFDRLTQSNKPIDQTNEWEDVPEDLPLIEDALPPRENVISSSVDTRITKRGKGRPKLEKEAKAKNPVGRPKKVSLPPAKVSIVDILNGANQSQSEIVGNSKTPKDTPRKLIRSIMRDIETTQDYPDVPELV